MTRFLRGPHGATGAALLFPLIIIGLVFSIGCSSTRMSDSQSDGLFRQAHYGEAADRLKQLMDKEGKDGGDRLLYLFDIGLSLHLAGRYEESNKVFLEAESLSDIKDYTSLANETATLLVSDNIKDYKGEDFEKVLVNVYLSMNFALMGNYEGALIEARKVNRKLYMMVSEGKKKYKQNAFARYLSAVLFEAQGEWNDAYVDYKKTRELLPEFPGLGKDLYRVASILSMSDETERWTKEFKLSEQDRKDARIIGPKSKKAEIVVLYQNGISPIKQPSSVLASIPEFTPRYNPVRAAEVEVDNIPAGQTLVLHDIQTTAIENLKEKYAGIIAKKVVGAGAKLVVANQIEQRTGSKALGAISRMLLFAADKADIRSWNLLPKDLQILRIPVDAGTHTVKLTPIGAGPAREQTVQVKAGKKVFVTFRYMP